MQSNASRTTKPWLSFLAFAAFFQAMGGLMGWITAQGVDGWYQTLDRSPLSPPDAAFGIVWSILYFLLSISAWLMWRQREEKGAVFVLALFAAHMVLNWLWSPLFFVAHSLAPSYFLILGLIFTAGMLAWLIYPYNKKAALIFAPYICWLTFAGHLSYYIWQNNG